MAPASGRDELTLWPCPHCMQVERSMHALSANSRPVRLRAGRTRRKAYRTVKGRTRLSCHRRPQSAYAPLPRRYHFYPNQGPLKRTLQIAGRVLTTALVGCATQTRLRHVRATPKRRPSLSAPGHGIPLVRATPRGPLLPFPQTETAPPRFQNPAAARYSRVALWPSRAPRAPIRHSSQTAATAR